VTEGRLTLVTLPKQRRSRCAVVPCEALAVLRPAFPTTAAGREWALSSWCSALRLRLPRRFFYIVLR
jgi:hypothetical protein